MFCVLSPQSPCDFNYLSQMHHLRYNVFYKNLNWKNGLRLHSQMEFDQYDHEDARYIVRINENDKVDACARLISTDHPYLLGYSFGEYVQEIAVPAERNTAEISRLCADPKTTPRNITGQLMAAILEYGLSSGITQYVSLSDVKIIPIVKRFGWMANKIGHEQHTGTEMSVALRYDVTEGFYDNVKRLVGVPEQSSANPNLFISPMNNCNNLPFVTMH